MNMRFFKIVSHKLFALLFFSLHLNLLCSNRCIDIENDSNYPMHINSNSPDLNINHQVPARSHSTITARITSIPNSQNMLLNAVVSNSVEQIILAIRAGGCLNQTVNGKKPLEWAILLGHTASIRCLLRYGATL